MIPAIQESHTSRAAARAIKPHAPSKRQQVLAYIARCGPTGATDEEIQEGLGFGPNSARPRRIELCNANPPLVVNSGDTRPTKGGNAATVWTLAPEPGAGNRGGAGVRASMRLTISPVASKTL